MAETDPIILHPATARQAAYPAWTADPAIALLFAALRDLNAVAARLGALHHVRPELGTDGVRGEIGEVASLFERCPGKLFDYGWRTRANGGACVALWTLLDHRRDAWIDARLAVEGCSMLAATAARDERSEALDREAEPVAAAWERFRGAR
jgi:hypothetical protein